MDSADWLRHFTSALTLTHAYVPKADYFFSFNSPSWSLCCEQLFYFSFPFLMILTKNHKRMLLLWCIFAVITVAGMSVTPEEYIKAYWYVNPITRFPDFILGMLLFPAYSKLKNIHISKQKGSLMEVAVLILFLAFYLSASFIPKVYRYSCYYWLPVALVILCFSLQKGIISRLLSNRALIIGGEISFSFYLIHLFIILTYAQWQNQSGIMIPWYISIPLIWVTAITLSWISYLYFEKPMNRLFKNSFYNKWNKHSAKAPA